MQPTKEMNGKKPNINTICTLKSLIRRKPDELWRSMDWRVLCLGSRWSSAVKPFVWWGSATALKTALPASNRHKMKKGPEKQRSPSIADSDSFENHQRKLTCANGSEIMNLLCETSIVYNMHTLGPGEKYFPWFNYRLANFWPFLLLFQSNSLSVHNHDSMDCDFFCLLSLECLFEGKKKPNVSFGSKGSMS